MVFFHPHQDVQLILKGKYRVNQSDGTCDILPPRFETRG